MFNKDFYPTPSEVVRTMLLGEKLDDKVILEPSAGKGNIIDFLHEKYSPKEVLFCENQPELLLILKSKAKFLAEDFLSVTSEMISHVEVIIMNPPFSNQEKHITHAYEIAPNGCKIISLCNAEMYINDYSRDRRVLKQIIDTYGYFEQLGEVFLDSERKTNVNIGLIKIHKGASHSKSSTEFDGFFLDEEEELEYGQSFSNGLIQYNYIRDVVNRYVNAIKLFDQQSELAVKMNELTSQCFEFDFKDNKPMIQMSFTQDSVPIKRLDFKKQLQKGAWNSIIKKMNLEKITTMSLKEDLNKFIEQQTQVPFTMRNIYKMISTIIGTSAQRMNTALEIVFDQITMHYHENRFYVEGWKTNSHYMLNKRFIFGYVCKQDDYNNKKGYTKIDVAYDSRDLKIIEDMLKALCFITGDDYYKFAPFRMNAQYKYLLFVDGKFKTADNTLNFGYEIIKAKENNESFFIHEHNPEYGKWFDWAYFRIRCYKKGTVHFEFKDEELWAKFNYKIAEIKGFPLFEKTSYSKSKKKK